MSRLLFLALIILPYFSFSQSCSDLIISEYCEGSGNNKAIELYNPTAEAINLSSYTLQRYSNGSANATDELQLDGVVEPFGTWIVVNGQTEDIELEGGSISLAVDPLIQAYADQLGNPYPDPLYMNGDDAVMLVKDGDIVVDIFGKPGEDPGLAWTDDASAGYTSLNGGAYLTNSKTLRRKPTVTQGVTTVPILFNVLSEYDSLPNNTWNGLGIHSCECDPNYIELSTSCITDYDFGGQYGISPNPEWGESLEAGTQGVFYSQTLHSLLPSAAEDFDPSIPPGVPISSGTFVSAEVEIEGVWVDISVIGLEFICLNNADFIEPCTYLSEVQYCSILEGVPNTSGSFPLRYNLTLVYEILGFGGLEVPSTIPGGVLAITSCNDDPTGCTDPGALNYDANATCDDGSCCYEGCTNNQACNYNPFACINDGTCLYEGNICDDGNANTILDTIGANCQCQGTLVTVGCTDPTACNYNPNATVAGDCQYPDGCTSSEACNYNPLAQCDDGSCVFQSSLIYSDEIDNCSNWNLVNAGSPYNPNVTFQCGVGLQPMGQYPLDPIESTTYDNGILMVDSDLNGNDNTCENTWAQRVDPFDLTAYSNVKIGFQNYYRDFSNYCESYLLLEISRDGFTWPDTETFTEAEGMVDFGDGDGSIQARWEVFPDFSNNDYSQNAEWTDFDISEIADGEEVWIRFRWSGSWGYVWMIDDITVFESPEYDVTLENPSYTNVFNGGFLEYTVWHPSQSTTVDLATEVLNNGYSDAVDVDVSIGVNGNTLGQTQLNIESDSTETYAVSYEIPIEPNTYNVDYEVDFSADECVGNNSFQQSFEVPGPFVGSITGTGGQYARDNGVFNSQQTNWIGGTYDGIGQYYEFFNPADIYGIQVALYDLNSGFVNSGLSAALYQYDGQEWSPVEYSDEILNLDGSEELLNSGYESPDQIKWTRFAFDTPISVNEGDLFMAVIEGYAEGVSVGMAESTSSLVDGYVYDGNWYYFNDQTPMIRFNLDPAFEGMSSSCKQPSACNYDNSGTINDPDLCIYSTSVAGLSVTTTPDCGLCNGVVEVEFVNSNNASQYMYNYTWYNSQGDVVSQDGPTFTSACEGEEYYVVVSTNCADSVSPSVAVDNIDEFELIVEYNSDGSTCGSTFSFTYVLEVDDLLADDEWVQNNTVFYLNDESNTLPIECDGDDCYGLITFNPIETTTYVFGVIYTDFCGVTHTRTYESLITIDPVDFELEIDANPTSGDTPLNVIFDNQTPNLGDYTFTWDFGDGTIVEDNGSFVQHLYESGGLWDVTLTAEENTTGCINELFNPQYIFSIGDGCPQGCTDSTACNYDSSAECDDGSCLEFDECGDCGGNGTLGCTDPTACNYEVQADCDDGSCLQLDECGECGGSGVSGCTDSMACNYDALATCDDDSCLQFDECGECGGNGIQGCTDSDACNYSVAATCEDGTCYFTPDVEITGANVVTAFTSESYEVVFIEGAAYQWAVTGGVTEGAIDGYQVSVFWATQGLGELCVTVTNGDCDPVSYCIDLVIAPDNTVTGCTDSEACNYDPLANQDNGNCFFAGDSCNDGNVNTVNDTIQANCNCEGDSILGCTDETACNYDATATIEDGSCLEEDECGNCGGSETSGCIDPSACNYDVSASCDDGTCEFDSCVGCTDATACNFDATATIDDGSCLEEDECGNCGGSETSGCIDPLACNYDAAADCDDGTCEFLTCAGCTDVTACNYDATATIDDDSCLEEDECGNCGGNETSGCTDADACNFNPAVSCDDGTCDFGSCAGCTDPTACNYLPNSSVDDGSCEFDSCAGCTDATACNYDATATIDDGSCFEEDECGNCGGTSTAGCIDPGACNYDVNADCNNDSCVFLESDCDTCSGEQDGTGTVVDNDADNDGVCDNDEIIGCQDEEACNYNMLATDSDNCIFPEGICDTCSGEQDGTGTVADNDADNDGVCDNDEIVGCQDETACNYDPSATDAGDCEYIGSYEISGNNTPVIFESTTYSYELTSGSTYEWVVTPGVISSGQGTSEIEAVWAEVGVGEICVIETNDGCVGQEVCFQVAILPTNIEEQIMQSINIFPNPASTSVIISIDESLINASYQLFDTQGRMVNEGVLTKTNTTLNTTELATGNYVISFDNDQGVVRQQILIER